MDASLQGPPLHPLAQTVLYLARPVDFLALCRWRYGDMFRIETVLFGPEVTLCNPEDIRSVFTGDPDVLHAGEANTLLEPLLGPRSVLLLDGAEHLRQRRLLMPPFHGERMVGYARAMQEAAEQAAERLPLGQPLSLHPHMQRLTLDVILRTVFGADERDAAPLREALAALLDRLSSGLTAFWTLPPMRFSMLGLSPWASFQRDLARADGLVYERIARRRAEGAGGRDVLSMLLDARDERGQPMTDAELRDELMTLLVAGHETTATMLCWAFDLLLSHPAALDRLLAELRSAALLGGPPSPSDIGKLPFLDAVLREVLRLRPVIPAVGRRLTAPMSLRGRAFPAGTLLVPAAYLVHTDPAIYPDPLSFRPERFLDAKVDPSTWFPFGGGARRCLGMAFALYEMKIVLATMLSRVQLRNVQRRPARIRVRTFTFAPDRGAEVVALHRAPAVGRA